MNSKLYSSILAIATSGAYSCIRSSSVAMKV